MIALELHKGRPLNPFVNAGGAEVTNRGQAFAPARSKQVEAGIKYDKGTFGASFGVYRIEQPSDGYVDAQNTYVRQGTQRNRGVELNIYGEPLDGLRLLAGATVMDTELSGTKNGANNGNRAIGVPNFQYNLGADWDVPGLEGVALNGRMLRTGGQFATAAGDTAARNGSRRCHGLHGHAVGEVRNIVGRVAVSRQRLKFGAPFFWHSVRVVQVELIELFHIGRDRKSTRLNSSHYQQSRMPSSA